MIPTRAELDVAVAAGHVARHDLDGLSLYNYTKRCVYGRVWSPTTMAARGILYRGDELVALPFPKFFNHDEPDCVIPDGPPLRATVKVDGVLGISYRHEGRVRWTTRGRLDSPPGKVAQRIWDEQHRLAELPEWWTLLVEVVSPETKIIVDYGGAEKLVVLAARHLDGSYVPRESLRMWCHHNEVEITTMTTVERDRSVAIMARNSSEWPASFEGWVLEWPCGTRVKVKSRAYLAVARLMQGMNERRAADLWYARAEVPAALSEEMRAWIAERWADLDFAMEEAKALAATFTFDQHWLKDRKAFALQHRNHPLFGELMRKWGGDRPDWSLVVYRQKFGAKPRPTGVKPCPS